MPTILSLMNKTCNTWVSQVELMRLNRRVVNLSRLGPLFVDLDTYRILALANHKPDELTASVLYFCADAGLSAPSMLIYSGRGIQAKRLLEGTIPRQALSRWNACQHYLADRLTHVGANPMTKDTGRVLCTVETVNSKSGEVYRMVHARVGTGSQSIRYNFKYLAETLLPAARWTIEQQRQKQAESRTKKKPFLLVSGGKADNLHGFSSRQLAWDRLEDLRKLAEPHGGIGESSRIQHLFWCLNFLLLSGAMSNKQMYHEAATLARELDPQQNSRSKELIMLFSKTKAYESGEKVTFSGKEYTLLYMSKSDTLISLFRVTAEEQWQLKTIVSQTEATERHRKREEVRRRAADTADQEIYEQSSLSRQKPWEALGMSRASWYRTGKLVAPVLETSPCVLRAEVTEQLQESVRQVCA